MDVQLCAQAAERCQADEISDSIIRNIRIAKTVIDMLVGDCIETSRSAIISVHLENLQQVLNNDKNFVTLSDDAEQGLGELEKFLHSNMYENPEVKTVSSQAAGWLEKIFNQFRNNPKLMPRFYQNLAGEFGLERTVCDYISGMTDWYCLDMIKD